MYTNERNDDLTALGVFIDDDLKLHLDMICTVKMVLSRTGSFGMVGFRYELQ